MFTAARQLGPVLTERRRDQGILSRIGDVLANPVVHNRLTALGSGLLMGQNWGQGLGMAGQQFLGISQAEQQQALAEQQAKVALEREERAARQARARLLLDEARLQSTQDYQNRRLALEEHKASTPPMATPSASQQGPVWVAPDGSWYTTTFNPNSGSYSLRNLNTGEAVDQLPEGATRAEQSGLQWRNKEEEDAKIEAVRAAEDAFGAITRLESLRELATPLAGPDFWTRAARSLAEVTGSDISGIDPTNLSQVKQIVAQLSLEGAKKFLRGQGQVTENEREMVRQATVDPERLTPEALNRVIDILVRNAKRDVDLWEGWRAKDPTSRGSFLEYRYDFRREAARAEPGPASSSELSDEELLDLYAPRQTPEANWDLLANEAEAYAGQSRIDALLRKKQALGY